MRAEEPDAGDEPYLLARNLLGIAAVVSDANRFAAGLWAIANLGTDLFVLDDGFQHLRLARDLNILVIDATDPWGGEALLPSGRLREPASETARADCTVITRTNQVSDVTSLTDDIRRLTKHRPIFTSSMQATHHHPLTNNGVALHSTNPLAAFCGIGNPQSFFKQLMDGRYSVVNTRQFPDHHRYTQSDVDSMAEDALSRGASALITTAKDAVKLGTLHIPMPCYVLEIKIQLDDEDEFRELMRRAIGNLKS